MIKSSSGLRSGGIMGWFLGSGNSIAGYGISVQVYLRAC